MFDINGILGVIFIAVVVLTIVLSKLGGQAFGVYQQSFTSHAENNLERMFMFLDYRKMFFGNIAALVIIPIVVYVLTSNVFYTVISVITLFAFPRVLVKVLEMRRREDIRKALPDALSQIAGNLRSGSTFTGALEILVSETKGPIGQEFGLLLKEQKVGISQQEALENLCERIDLEEMNLIATAVLIARDIGGNLAETLERLSKMLRRKIEMEQKIKALTAQGKLQGIVVSLLPFGIMGALTVVDPENIGPMFSTYLGWGFMGVIILMVIMGGTVVRKIVTIDV